MKSHFENTGTLKPYGYNDRTIYKKRSELMTKSTQPEAVSSVLKVFNILEALGPEPMHAKKREIKARR